MRKHMGLTAVLLVTTLSLSGWGCQRSDDRPVQAANEPVRVDERALTQADRDFLTAVEQSNVQEQALARLALQKTQNNDVRDFAEMLEDDHTDSLRNTVDLMMRHNVPHSTGLDDARKEAVSGPERLSGPAFDREFVKLMVDKHRQAVEKFKIEADSGRNNDVVDFAEDLLPTLEKHQAKAQELNSKLTGATKN
jgi:putative membrane protein